MPVLVSGLAGLLRGGPAPVPALWLCTGSAVVAELCGRVGPPLLIIDTEHAPADRWSVQAQLQATAATPAIVAVRVPSADPVLIGQYLDLGPAAIMVPQVTSAPQAARAAAAVRYPPAGTRGVGGAFARAGGWGTAGDLRRADAEVALIVQLESRQAVAAASGILSAPGVDAGFVGTSDLAADLGHLGQPGHPDVVRAAEAVIRAGLDAGVPVGVNAFDPDQAARYAGAGAAFVGLGSDAGVLVAGVGALAERA